MRSDVRMFSCFISFLNYVSLTLVSAQKRPGSGELLILDYTC